MTRLTVDLGNSFCKLCAWRAPAGAAGVPEPIRSAAFEAHPPALFRELPAWVADLEPVERLAICSVAPAGSTAHVGEVLERALGRSVEVVVNPESGLENRCRTPETVGADRLFAARGALWIVRRSCLVVDAGTAVTVDAVQAPADAPGSPGGAGRFAGSFLGGAIAPGPELLAHALAEGTAGLPRIEPRVEVEALGRDTEGALRSGVGVGFRGAVRELARRIAAEADLTTGRDFPIVVTGGARDHLLVPEPVFEGEVVVHGDLVHLGLLAALE